MNNKIKLLPQKWLLILVPIALLISYGYMYALQLVFTGKIYMDFAEAAYKAASISPIIWGVLLVVVVAINGIRRTRLQGSGAKNVFKSIAILVGISGLVVFSTLLLSGAFVITNGFGKSLAQQHNGSIEGLRDELSHLKIFNNANNGEIEAAQDGSNLTGGQNFARTDDVIAIKGTFGQSRAEVEANLARQGYTWDKSFYQELGSDNHHFESVVLRYSNRTENYSLHVHYYFTQERSVARPFIETYNGEYDAFDVKSASIKLGPLDLDYPF